LQEPVGRSTVLVSATDVTFTPPVALTLIWTSNVPLNVAVTAARAHVLFTAQY
jgi:hypothetical protein